MMKKVFINTIVIYHFFLNKYVKQIHKLELDMQAFKARVSIDLKSGAFENRFL